VAADNLIFVWQVPARLSSSQPSYPSLVLLSRLFLNLASIQKQYSISLAKPYPYQRVGKTSRYDPDNEILPNLLGERIISEAVEKPFWKLS
jgi:hypothetical protein